MTTTYTRNRLPPAEIPEGVTYYALKKHILRMYPDETLEHVLADIHQKSLLDPEYFRPSDERWMVAWFIPVQRTGDTYRIMYREMSGEDRTDLILP